VKCEAWCFSEDYLVAVTTDTLLGVAMPVTGGGVVPPLADAVLLDPLQPVSRPATAATQAML
jgi:hypothetical protein